MRPFRLGARWASSALAVLLLASSLTCLTAACATLCAGTAGPVALSTGASAAGAQAEAALPPCHRRAAAEAPASGPTQAPLGACGAGSPCCAQWLNDHATLRLDDPAPLRTLLPNGAALVALPLAVSASAFAIDPPDGVTVPPDPVHFPSPAAPRAATGTRGPPAVAAAA